jgi:hypothetical protein
VPNENALAPSARSRVAAIHEWPRRGIFSETQGMRRAGA